MPPTSPATRPTERNRPSVLDGALEAPSSAADMVVDRLMTAIAVGEYLPGSRLPSERDLAASLGVGRVTVRTALAHLSDQGLLQTVRGRGGGSFVREQQATSAGASMHRALSARRENLLDVFEAVRLLHGTIARAAAENRTDEDARALRDRLEQFRVAGTGRESQRADARFHEAVIAAAHNATLQNVLLELESRISLTAPAHLWGSVDGMREMELRALSDHEQLVRAIIGRDQEEAGTIGAEHARIDVELFEKAVHRAEHRVDAAEVPTR